MTKEELAKFLDWATAVYKRGDGDTYTPYGAFHEVTSEQIAEHYLSETQ